jgi:hypothetical protein
VRQVTSLCKSLAEAAAAAAATLWPGGKRASCQRFRAAEAAIETIGRISDERGAHHLQETTAGEQFSNRS